MHPGTAGLAQSPRQPTLTARMKSPLVLKLLFSKHTLAGFHFSSPKLSGRNACSWRDAPASVQRDNTAAGREPEGQAQSVLSGPGTVSAGVRRPQSPALGEGASGSAAAAVSHCTRGSGVTASPAPRQPPAPAVFAFYYHKFWANPPPAEARVRLGSCSQACWHQELGEPIPKSSLGCHWGCCESGAWGRRG